MVIIHWVKNKSKTERQAVSSWDTNFEVIFVTLTESSSVVINKAHGWNCLKFSLLLKRLKSYIGMYMSVVSVFISTVGILSFNLVHFVQKFPKSFSNKILDSVSEKILLSCFSLLWKLTCFALRYFLKLFK